MCLCWIEAKYFAEKFALSYPPENSLFFNPFNLIKSSSFLSKQVGEKFGDNLLLVQSPRFSVLPPAKLGG